VRSGEYQAALGDLNKAITLDPELLVAYVNRGVAAYGLGDFEAALADYDHVAQVDPERFDTYAHRSRALTMLGLDEQAAADIALLVGEGADIVGLEAELAELRALR